MPEVCRFLGIIITMYFNDHNPPHFHVRYREHRAVLRIQPLMLLDELDSARAMPDFRVWVRFSDATEGTVIWANGFDLAPKYLYAKKSKQAVA